MTIVAATAGRIGLRGWRVLTSMRTALVLTLVLAALAVIGTVVAQASPEQQVDGPAHVAWLASIQPRYGPWTQLLDGLQLFAVFGSVWFKAAVLGLIVSLTACCVARSRMAWRSATRYTWPSPAEPRAGSHPHAVMSTSLDADGAARRIRAVLERRGYRTAATGQPGAPVDLAAVRFRWAPFASIVGHASIVVIMLGAVVGSTWGFHDSRVSVPVGATVSVGHDTGLTIKAAAFSDAYYTDGSPRDFASDLVLYRDGAPVANGTVRVNEPLRLGDVTVYQSYFGPAISMRINAAGRTIFQGDVPLEWMTADGARLVGRMPVVGHGATLYLMTPAAGLVDPSIRAGQVRARLIGTAGESSAAVISQGRSVMLDGLELTFLREDRYTGLIVASDPGRPLVWLGAALLVLGFVAALTVRSRRVWVRITDLGGSREIRLMGTSSHGRRQEAAAFRRLTAEVEAAVGSAAERAVNDGGRPWSSYLTSA